MRVPPIPNFPRKVPGQRAGTSHEEPLLITLTQTSSLPQITWNPRRLAPRNHAHWRKPHPRIEETRQKNTKNDRNHVPAIRVLLVRRAHHLSKKPCRGGFPQKNLLVHLVGALRIGHFLLPVRHVFFKDHPPPSNKPPPPPSPISV